MLRVAWDHLSQENQLINNRLTWFGTLQGLLTAAMALLWGYEFRIILIVCLAGIAVSISIGISCCRANKVIDELDETLKNFLSGEFEKYQPVLRWHPSRQGPFYRLMPGFFIPWMFCLWWVLVGFYKYVSL
jgi:hypothetical protein